MPHAHCYFRWNSVWQWHPLWIFVQSYILWNGVSYQMEISFQISIVTFKMLKCVVFKHGLSTVRMLMSEYILPVMQCLRHCFWFLAFVCLSTFFMPLNRLHLKYLFSSLNIGLEEGSYVCVCAFWLFLCVWWWNLTNKSPILWAKLTKN